MKAENEMKINRTKKNRMRWDFKDYVSGGKRKQ